MILERPAPQVRTGITIPHSINDRQRKSTGVARVASPVLNYSIASARGNQIVRRKPFEVDAITNGYLAESYIRQGIDKYADLVLKEGWCLVGRDELVSYLNKRFDLMGLMSDPSEPFTLVIERAVRDFIKYGNAFLVLKRTSALSQLQGLNGKLPIGAYFNLPVPQMQPEVNTEGKVVAWVQKTQRGEKRFPIGDILHFTYCREAAGIWGMPAILSVIEDVRALRQAEENVLKLIHKHLNPLIHQTVPDITGTGEGRQEDIDDAARSYQTMATDGIIITPPNHIIKVLGAESQALRAEGYLEWFKKRVFTGLGVSSLAMGENEGGALGTAESLTVQMHNRAKMFHYILSQYFTIFIVNELLLEGGYNPWFIEEDKVIWKWNEIETERRIKEQTHALNLWTMNSISMEEFRNMTNLPNHEPQWQDFYVHQVQIPQVIASRTGLDPLTTDPDDLETQLTGTRNKQSPKAVAGQGGDPAPPSNQHSPKVTPNAPTAHKMSTDSPFDTAVDSFTKLCEAILAIIPDIQNGSRTKKDIVDLLKNAGLAETSYLPLAGQLIKDITTLEGAAVYIRVNARLSNERATIMSSMLQLKR